MKRLIIKCKNDDSGAHHLNDYNNMKGNLKLKVSILMLFFSFCCIKSTWAQEVNCGNKIQIVKTSPASIQNMGRIEAQIEGSGSFEANLFSISGKGKTLIKTIEGSNSDLVVFEDLNEGNYKILVEYTEIKDPMCQFLQLAGISIKKQ